MITALQLKSVCPSLTIDRAGVIASLLVNTCKTYAISKRSLPFFLANLIHESGGFSIKAENLNYTTPARLVAVWPRRFNITTAKEYVRKPEMLASLVYNGRMGNKTGTNDGFIFRGGGFAQITGRDAYEQYLKHLASMGRAEMFNAATLATTVQAIDMYAMDSAGWFYSIFKRLNGTFDFLTVCKRWNGGTIGYHERLALFNKCKTI